MLDLQHPYAPPAALLGERQSQSVPLAGAWLGKSSMSQLLQYHPEALHELIDAAGYYAERSSVVGDAFTELVDEALALIVERPLLAPAWPGRPDVRRRVLARYPYAILYTVEPEQIFVVAIEHAKRRPGYWLTRL